MADDDSVVEIRETSWLGRLGGSLAGAAVGLLLFLGSFVLLFWNEGRAVEALDALAGGQRIAVAVAADRVDPANEGRLVHLSGPTAVAGTVEDPVFHVAQPGLLRLERLVEMYQWREKEETSSEKNLGGSETSRTVHRYAKEWSASRIDSSGFKKQEGHGNPAMAYSGATFEHRAARLGAFTLSPQQVRRIDAFETLAAPAPGGAERPPAGFRWVGDQLVRGADPDQPQVGDYRVRFRVVPVQPVSVVALQSGTGLTAYRGPDGHEIELVATGLHPVAAMFQKARSDEVVLTWILRGVGYLMMLFGVVLVAAPLAWLASLLPFLAGLVNAAAFGLGLLVATPLTLLTIALGWLAHRPLIGGGLIVAAVVAALLIRRFLPRRHGPGGAFPVAS